MSKKNILLTTQIRTDLKELLQLLKLKKAAIALELDMPASTLSETTGINGKRKINEEKWLQLQDLLTTEVESQSSKQIIDSIIQRQTSILLRNICGQGQHTTVLAKGPIKPQEHNYIIRDSDKLLESRLQNGCKYFWINGGIKKGKTSLLNKIREFSKDNNYEVHSCDLANLITNSITPLSDKNILQYILNETTNSDEVLTSKGFDQLCNEFKNKFVDWKKNGTLSEQKFFIIFDHLDNLFDPLLKDNQAQYNAIGIIQFVLQSCLKLSRELTYIRFAIVVEDYLYTSAQISPLINQASRVALKPFTADEIVKLWQLCKPKTASFDIEEEQALSIIDKISGNPYLIQHLFYDIYNNALPSKPLNDYLKHITKALSNNDHSNLPGYNLFREQLIQLIKKVALQTTLNTNTESYTYDELIRKLQNLERNFIDPTIHSSLKRLDIIEEGSNQLHPIIAQILAVDEI